MRLAKEKDPRWEAVTIDKPVPLFKDLCLAAAALGGFLLICLLLLHYVAEPVRVNGSSMYDTLEDGDMLIINKMAYRFSSPKVFDIIVFYHPDEKQDENQCIKRVIALPGQTVRIEDGVIYVDDIVLEESYGFEKIEKAKDAASPITLGEDEYFVLGDNRNNSVDSRYRSFGLVQKSQILGKASWRLFPLSRMGRLDSDDK